ncbi:unnamed protein product [Ectocarpus sp. 12 AP-2014]
MAKRRNSQVGFRDDTSYLTAHYGGRSPRRTARVTANGIPRPPEKASPVGSQADPTVKTIAPTRGSSPASAGVDVSRGETVGVGARKAGEGRFLVRPTLSEQLASIGKAAEDITAGIRKSHGLKPLEGAILTTPSESFLVGKLRCKYPSPVAFFNHKCVYTFHHPFEATRITMEMFFRDMRSAALDSPRRELRFKIDHPLCHYTKDYYHNDPSHFVLIQFSSGLDAERVLEKIMPLIRRSGGVR